MAQKPLDSAGGVSPRINVRLPRPQHERVIELAGDGRGAMSEFVRQAVADALEREDEGPPDPGG